MTPAFPTLLSPKRRDLIRLKLTSWEIS